LQNRVTLGRLRKVLDEDSLSRRQFKRPWDTGAPVAVRQRMGSRQMMLLKGDKLVFYSH
jgi:hypothetical protein